MPYPLEKGDKLRAFNQIKELSKKHDIFLCALNDHRLHPEAESILKAYCKEIYIFPISKWSIVFNVLLFHKRQTFTMWIFLSTKHTTTHKPFDR